MSQAGDETGDRTAPLEHGKRPDPHPAAPRPARRPVDLVFDDPLDQQTSDDTDAGWGERPSGRDVDWYLRERPPHHG